MAWPEKPTGEIQTKRNQKNSRPTHNVLCRRRSRHPKKERNALPDNWHRVGAPGGAGPLATASRPGAPHLRVPEFCRVTGLRKAGQGASQAPGASRRSNPLSRETENPREGGEETAGRPA